jgi:hypothetical protein
MVNQSATSESNNGQFRRMDSTATYTDRSYGFSIDLSRDFYLSNEQGDVLFFTSRKRAGTVIIRPRPGLSVATIQAAMRNGFESDAISITPTGPPMSLKINNGQGLYREVVGVVNDREVKGILAGIVGGDQQGYMILVGSIESRWEGFKISADAMLNSFSINRVEPGHHHERWQKRLQGYRLVFGRGYGNYIMGGAQISEYHFCTDGTYRQRTDSTDTYSTGYRRSTYGTTSKDKGTWQIQLDQGTPYLTMFSKNGSRSSRSITEKEGYIFLGEVPYLVTENVICD